MKSGPLMRQFFVQILVLLPTHSVTFMSYVTLLEESPLYM